MKFRRIPFSLVVVLAGLGGGCTVTFEPAHDPIDRDDDRLLRPIELAVTDNSRFDALAAQELSYQGPFRDSNGQTYITVFTTGAHASGLEQLGFRIRGIAAQREGFIAYGPGCSLPPSCSTPTDSEYFKSYDDIVDELQALDASSTAIRLTGIGLSQHDGRPIMAIQFGPTEPRENVPTLYVLGTYHGREWMSTAVTLQLARWMGEVTVSGTVNGDSDPNLALALAYAAIVIVPVVNPDGYEYSRDGHRSWRGNLNLTDCSGYGVDLNRNHSTAWDEDAPAPFTETSCGQYNGAATYRGQGAASELETQAIERLLIGEGFLGQVQVPVAVISYHSYADMVVYPDGYKATSSQGPRCGLTYENNCFNPDFTVTRDLFGDTHSNLFVDDASYLPTQLEFPYIRDHSRTTLYGVSGDVNLHATYGPMPTLAITPELPSSCLGFGVECHADAKSIVLAAATDQLDVIRRILPVASTLVSTTPATSYGPNIVGTLSSGLWTREYQENLNNADTVRATFTKSVFIPKSTGSLTATIDGVSYNYDRGRKGAQYELYFVRMNEREGLDPLCIPCEVQTTSDGIEGEQIDGAVNCESCINLCDAGRLDATGWDLLRGTRGGKEDCWWTAKDADGELKIPGGLIPHPNTTHCHFTFSAIWGPLASSQIYIERETNTGWETLQAVRYSAPYNGNYFPSDRLVSYAYEANNFLGSGLIPSFRLRVAGAAPDDEVQVFDPVIYCRIGSLP